MQKRAGTATTSGGRPCAKPLPGPLANRSAAPSLRRLRIDASSTAIPHLSILAGADNVVRPPLAHALPGGDVIVLEDCGHNAILYDEETVRLVKERISRHRAPR